MGYQYIRPKTIEQAITAMQKASLYHLLAGGTDLLVRMKLGRIVSGMFIDIGDLADLQQIVMDDDGITIGAAVHHTQIANSVDVMAFAPALATASAAIGSPQIRNRGTIGGNCGNASPAGDTITALLAYGATANIAGAEGERSIPLAEFFLGPGRTVLQQNELIQSFSFKVQKKGAGSSFEKLGRRKALAISIVNAASFIAVDENDIVTKARISLGSVAATPIRMTIAENMVVGKKVTADLWLKAAEIAANSVTPIDDVRSEAGYRKKMAAVLTKRSLEKSYMKILK